MILPCRCWERACVHYTGVSQPDETEQTEVHACEAFPEGIPDEICYGSDLHLEEVEGDHDIQFERDFSVNTIDRIA